MRRVAANCSQMPNRMNTLNITLLNNFYNLLDGWIGFAAFPKWFQFRSVHGWWAPCANACSMYTDTHIMCSIFVVGMCDGRGAGCWSCCDSIKTNIKTNLRTDMTRATNVPFLLEPKMYYTTTWCYSSYLSLSVAVSRINTHTHTQLAARIHINLEFNNKSLSHSVWCTQWAPSAPFAKNTKPK